MGLKHQETQIITQAPSALPPLIAIAFGAPSIALNTTTTLVFTITNPNTDVGLTGIAFVDNLPAGIQVGPVPGVIDACTGGTVTAVAGSSQISYFGGTLNAGASCTITVTVKGVLEGAFDDQTEPITSREGGTGLPSNVAHLDVTAAVAGAALILNSLAIIDVSDVTAPTVASNSAAIPFGGAAGVSGATEAIDTTNHIFYVFSGNGGVGGDRLQAVDVSNRAVPAVLGQVACTKADANYRTGLTSNLHTLATANTGDAGITTAPNILQVFNVSNPAAMVNVANYDLSSAFALSQKNPTSMVVRGNLAYIESDNDVSEIGVVHLGIYDLSNPAIVTQLSLTQIFSDPGDVDVGAFLADVIDVSGTLYAIFWIQKDGAGTQVIETWNVTNSAAPTFVNNVVIPPTIRTNRWSQVAGGHLFGASISPTQTNIIGVDVSDPTAPAVDGATAGVNQRAGFSVRAAVVGGTRYVFVCQTLASASTNRELQIYDASVPGALVAKGAVIYRVGGSNQQLHLDV